MSAAHTKQAHSDALSAVRGAMDPAQRQRLEAAATLPEAQINTVDPDAPEVTDWSNAVRGRFYRPVKQLKGPRSMPTCSRISNSKGRAIRPASTACCVLPCCVICGAGRRRSRSHTTIPEHAETFVPMRTLFGLVREIAAAVTHEVGAFG